MLNEHFLRENLNKLYSNEFPLQELELHQIAVETLLTNAV